MRRSTSCRTAAARSGRSSPSSTSFAESPAQVCIDGPGAIGNHVPVNFAMRGRLSVSRGPFAAFTAAHVVAATADALVTVSLAGSLFFNLSPDASRGQVLLYLTITMTPFAVLAPLVGPAIDRFRRGDRLVAALCFALRSLCALGLAMTLFELSFYVFALALLVTSKASGVVRQALVPRLVLEHQQLVEANSHLARIGTIAGGIAGALGAWLLSATSAPVLLQLASVLFALSAVAALRVRTEAPEPAPALLEYAELHSPHVVGASSGLMALRAGVGYFVFMVAFALRRESEPAWVFGLALGAYGVGSFAGNVVAPLLRRRLSEDRLMAGALAAAAAVAALGVLGINRRTLVVVAVVFGLSATIGRQAFDSLLQRTAPDALRGRVFARYEMRFQLTWVLGGVLATAITLPVEIGMAVLTVLFVPVVAIYARGAGEAVRFAPAPEQEVLGPAQLRLARAEAWSSAGNHRLAVVEAAATVDLALAAFADHAGILHTAPRPTIDRVACARLDALRHAAVDRHGEINAQDAAEALAIASASLGVSRSDPSSESATGPGHRPA
jgi:MFS family permease